MSPGGQITAGAAAQPGPDTRPKFFLMTITVAHRPANRTMIAA